MARKPVAYRDALHHGGQAGAHRVINIVLEVKPLESSAGLTIVEEGTPELAFGDRRRVNTDTTPSSAPTQFKTPGGSTVAHNSTIRNVASGEGFSTMVLPARIAGAHWYCR